MKKLLLFVVLVLYVQAYSLPSDKIESEKPIHQLVNENPQMVCATDDQCPQIQCITYPCPFYACKESKCELQEAKEICIRGGCSGQLCVSYYADTAISTCEWRDEYECYNSHGICTTGDDGSCQWQQTEELLNCISDKS